MREWWWFHVEERLSQLPIDWDTVFLYTWTVVMVSTVMSGGV